MASIASCDSDDAPNSPLALFVKRARDETLNNKTALQWYPAINQAPTVYSYKALYRASLLAAKKLSAVLQKTKKESPPMLSPLQTSEEHKAHLIGLLVPEGPELVIITLAVAMVGAAVVPFSENDPPTRLAMALRDSKCAIVVVDDFDERRLNSPGRTSSLRIRLERAVAILRHDDNTSDLSVVLNTRDTVDDGVSGAKRHSIESLNINQSIGSFAGDDKVLAGADLDLETCRERHMDTLSHVFFTSGSTGAPKGCLGTRGGLAYFCDGKNEAHSVDTNSIVLVASPAVFDPSFGDFFATLACGASLAICAASLTLSNLGWCLSATKASHLTATPTALGSVYTGSAIYTGSASTGLASTGSASTGSTSAGSNAYDTPGSNAYDTQGSTITGHDSHDRTTHHDLPHLKVVALGGEQTPSALVDFWIDKVDILANTYGVTECVVYQTFSVMERGFPDSRKYLGKVMGNGLKLIHAAAPGNDPLLTIDDYFEGEKNQDEKKNTSRVSELWLCGPQVGLGYASDTKNTHARFMVITDTATGKTSRYFRTGDMTKATRINNSSEERIKHASTRIDSSHQERTDKSTRIDSSKKRTDAVTRVDSSEERKDKSTRIDSSEERTDAIKIKIDAQTNLKPDQARILVGRRDGQVKIRGRRVELGEIECVLLGCFGAGGGGSSSSSSSSLGIGFIQSVAVTVTGKTADGGSARSLVAWMVRPGVFPGNETEKETSSEDSGNAVDSGINGRKPPMVSVTPDATTCDTLRWVLQLKLPKHMVPVLFAFVDKLPVTNSGKTDRSRLAKLQTPGAPNRNEGTEEERSFHKHETNSLLFVLVKQIWAVELGVPPTQIERASQFLELGGDSMVAVRVCRGAWHALVATTNGDESLSNDSSPKDKNKQPNAIGAHGEALIGALAPGSLTNDVSVSNFVGRLRLDIENGLFGETVKARFLPPAADGAPDLSSTANVFVEKSSHQSVGVSLLYRAAAENNPVAVEVLLNNGVPVDGWRVDDKTVGARCTPTSTPNTSHKSTPNTHTNTSRPTNTTHTTPMTPLHAACAAGAETAAMVLVSKTGFKKRIRRRARRGATALSLALASQPPFSVAGLVALLNGGDGVLGDDGATQDLSFKKGSKKPTKGKTTGKSSCLFHLDDDKQSLLHSACRSGTSAGVIHWLIGKAQELETQQQTQASQFIHWTDRWGRSALHWAALNGHRQACVTLLAFGADRSQLDENGETAVALAERRYGRTGLSQNRGHTVYRTSFSALLVTYGRSCQYWQLLQIHHKCTVCSYRLLVHSRLTLSFIQSKGRFVPRETAR